MADSETSMSALYWRTPPALTAASFLAVAALCALNIYWHPSNAVRAFTILLAIAAFVWAVVGMRMFLVVDDEGATVRYIGRETFLPWSEIDEIDVVAGVRGAHTVRFTCTDGRYVDVPPSLLQPSKPTAKPAAIARLKSTVAQMQARRVGA
jgi:hypothetical protein